LGVEFKKEDAADVFEYGIAFSIENDGVILNRKSPHAGKRFFIESELSMKNSIAIVKLNFSGGYHGDNRNRKTNITGL